jgi:hypothetical protein
VGRWRGGGAGGAQRQIPFGNDRQKSKGKGNSRSFDCAAQKTRRFAQDDKRKEALLLAFAQDDKRKEALLLASAVWLRTWLLLA